jgi:hypothetical protein
MPQTLRRADTEGSGEEWFNIYQARAAFVQHGVFITARVDHDLRSATGQMPSILLSIYSGNVH